YVGNFTVNGGVLAVSADNTLGAAGNMVSVNPAGTLRYTATTATSRFITLNAGTLEAASGATLTLNGATVGGGFLRGSGSFALTGNTAIVGTTTLTSTTSNQTGPASLTNFTNGGSLTNASGQSLAWNGGLNQSSGNITVNGAANVNDFVSNGVLSIP